VQKKKKSIGELQVFSNKLGRARDKYQTIPKREKNQNNLEVFFKRERRSTEKVQG
jgi:hypothetical protein